VTPRPHAPVLAIDPADALVDGVTAAAVFHVPRGTFRSWASRHPDELPIRGYDAGGRALYRWGDLCAIAHQRSPASRARRTVAA
jgi:hypothetical protein